MILEKPLPLFDGHPNRFILTNGKHPICQNELESTPFVRMNWLGWPFNDGKDFSKISQPAKRNGAYHLQFDFS